MNYNQFSKKQNLIDIILTKFGILITEKLIIKINHEPDYEISPYMRERETDYYFYNSWNFKHHFSFVIDVDIVKNHIFHYDDFINMSCEYGISYYTGEECEFLLSAVEKDSDALETNGFGSGTENFKINNLRIGTIDNLESKVYYEGSFWGASYEIDQNDFAIYSMINVIATPLYIDDKPFYNSLLAESFILLKERKYKLSYFLLYSAFDSFINYELGSADEQGRLKDKLKELFSSRFSNLNNHPIYTGIIKLYDQYTNNRNAIAHGKSPIEVDEEMVEKSFIFVLTMISSYLTGADKFDDLYNEITR